MSRSLKIVVVGTMGSNPYAGMAWMHMQIAGGLQRLGHDVYYFETTSTWPYDPVRQVAVCDSDYVLPYIQRVARSFGLGDRWVYRRSYSDKAWFGMSRQKAEDLLANADVVFNIAGATRFAEENLDIGHLVYFGTDPVYHELAYMNNDAEVCRLLDEHDTFVTYGENIGTPHSPIPPLPNLKARTRQPVLIDLWNTGKPVRNTFTTVGNWKQAGHDITYKGEIYTWSKHHEFLKVIHVPKCVPQSIEFATGLSNLSEPDRRCLESNGWLLVDGHSFTEDPWPYRDYIFSSAGEFTVAKDQNVRLKSGWFSERSCCYLAAGRPVVTQDTGFGTVLPTGEGLLTFLTAEEAIEALLKISMDYDMHSKAAKAIAHEYFRAETVLKRLLDDIGV